MYNESTEAHGDAVNGTSHINKDFDHDLISREETINSFLLNMDKGPVLRNWKQSCGRRRPYLRNRQYSKQIDQKKTSKIMKSNFCWMINQFACTNNPRFWRNISQPELQYEIDSVSYSTKQGLPKSSVECWIFILYGWIVNYKPIAPIYFGTT